MSKILVAGAGHGGLSAAAILAKNGFDVTVIEISPEESIGHDWHDTMDIPAFTFADIPVPDEKDFRRGIDMCYLNPKKTVKIGNPTPADPSSSAFISIDRKFLIRYLISHCRHCGVKFIFGCAVTEAVCTETRVTGLKVLKDENEEILYADMIIDAAGMNSPVRRSLPESFGIQRDIPEDEIFEIYRAYYENTQKILTSPDFSIFFYNCNKSGIDWVITDPDYIDVLIGKFGTLTDKEIEASLNDIRAAYPGTGTTPIRGGVRAKIPLSKTLSLLVADSYALIGDSGSMTVPLNGSGIDLSLQAGKLLATSVIAAKKNGFRKEDLWSYQYRYFTLFGNSLIPVSILRRFLSSLTADDIDFFLEKGLLTETEIGFANGNFSAINASYILEKLRAAAPKIKLTPRLIKAMRTMPLLPSVYKALPVKWDEKDFLNWQKLYNTL